MNRSNLQLTAAIAAVLSLNGCGRKAAEPVAPAEPAAAFVERTNREMAELSRELSAAGYAYATFINQDTEYLNAKANERYLAYFSAAVEAAKAYQADALEPADARALQLLKLGVAAPAPQDPAKRSELASVTSKMEGMYGAAKYCPEGPQSCKDQTQLTDILATSRNYDELLEAWSSPTRAPASWALQTWARCGAPITT
jgi:peptidyl-dipeptidase A